MQKVRQASNRLQTPRALMKTLCRIVHKIANSLKLKWIFYRLARARRIPNTRATITICLSEPAVQTRGHTQLIIHPAARFLFPKHLQPRQILGIISRDCRMDKSQRSEIRPWHPWLKMWPESQTCQAKTSYRALKRVPWYHLKSHLPTARHHQIYLWSTRPLLK